MTATYVKLQDAHAAETGAAGTWQKIGYIAPGGKNGPESYTTNVFDYTNSFKGADKGTTMVGSIDADTEGWRATAKTALNDCKISSYWTLAFNKSGDGSALKYKAEIKSSGGTDADCEALTANFTNIAHQ
ncbi:hypothetical protein [Fibrobacter sp.]|uniref:hypothetical protein n=1 Tax=Fibrobacter sp. TaxID=35828 RepID=UPI0025C2F7BA|nr:hypothetical protein [Fibrobacter sp.]MBR3071805.1 hypothetical protein [Fibrobacter sp.]